MKKILITGAFALFLFASCKKDYTCSCTTTVGSTTFVPEKTTIVEATKRQAKANCIDKKYEETQMNGNVSLTIVTTTDCELK